MDSLAHRDFTYELATLLKPISEDNPSGASLRYEPVYDQIKEARRDDDPNLERGVWQMTLKKSDWGAVQNLCVDCLKKRTKDLQIGAWLTEAWLNLYGLAGFRDGIRLLNAFSEDFWETVHPVSEDGEIEYRVAPFEWANEKFPVLLKLMPITNPGDEDTQRYSWADWEYACRPHRPDPNSRKEPEPPRLTQEQFQESLTKTSTRDLTDLLQLTDASLNSLSALNATLDEKCGKHAPGLGGMTSILTSVRGLLYTAVRDRKADEPEPVVEADTGSEETENEEGENLMMIPVKPEEQTPDQAIESGAVSSGPIRNRAEAYRRLSEAADYLLRTEPHSPVPYLVKRAVTWGSKSLEEILQELVRNNSELSEIYRLLQIGRGSE
jgi:type VI secretion system ImpA family protein